MTLLSTLDFQSFRQLYVEVEFVLLVDPLFGI